MALTAGAPAELAGLRARLAEIADLQYAGGLLSWDQNVCMPPAGADARAEQSATLEGLVHARMTDPEHARLVTALEPWSAALDPDSDDARLIRVARRDLEKAVRVPQELAVELARESSRGYADWMRAREAGEFAPFRDALSRQVELRRRYAACFPDAEHPYDVLLDDFEPGMTTAEARTLFEALLPPLSALVAEAAADDGPPMGGVMTGTFDLGVQRTLLLDVLSTIGFDPERFRLDVAPHPFAMSLGAGDVRVTTRYSSTDLAFSLYSGLHEMGHALYEAGYDPALRRSPLHECASLGVHESQSRLWENAVGRSRPFAEWLLPRLRSAFPDAYADLDAGALYRGLNAVQRTPIRTEADETTYNLHVGLRFELELALLEERLEVVDLPAAWSDGLRRLLGIEPASDAEGVLQDVHWSQGLFGYFPTYTVGNVVAAQLWTQLRADLPDLDDAIRAGELRPLREWLGEHVHRHGRKFTQRELVRRATRGELSPEPLLAYLRVKLADAGVIRAPAPPPSPPRR